MSKADKKPEAPKPVVKQNQPTVNGMYTITQKVVVATAKVYKQTRLPNGTQIVEQVGDKVVAYPNGHIEVMSPDIFTERGFKKV